MNAKSTKAILVVSFGTSYEKTRKLTIEAIEKEIQNAYPDYCIYRAWTSKMIIAKLKKRDQLFINNVTEAVKQMLSDGVTDLIVQPTHVINGVENDLMKRDILAFSDSFHSIAFGSPLLTSEADSIAVIQAVAEEFSDLPKEDALVLMGHGTTHYANSIYAALDYTFKDKGYPNIFLGTVEAYPSMESLLKMVKNYRPKTVHLAPFMIVAGDHARNDMAGDDPDSWYSQFIRAGFQVESHLLGLGQYPGIRRIFIQHIQDAMEQNA